MQKLRMLRVFSRPNIPEAGVLGTLGVVLTHKAVTGGLSLYIHPRYTSLLLVAGLVLIGISLSLLVLPNLSMPRSLLFLPLVVLLLALLVPARPLGASMVPGKSLAPEKSDALVARWQSQRSDDSTTWTLLEWTAATRQQDLNTLVGKQARFEGFVFRDTGLANDEVFVGRYVITCCTADGTAISLRVKAPNAADLGTDTWARVEGTFAVVMVEGKPVGQIQGTLTMIDTPSVPYLYP